MQQLRKVFEGGSGCGQIGIPGQLKDAARAAALLHCGQDLLCGVVCR
jgi:hypothetical protein